MSHLFLWKFSFFHILFCLFSRNLHVWLCWSKNLEVTITFSRVPSSDPIPNPLRDVQPMQLKGQPLVTIQELDYALAWSLQFTIFPPIWALVSRFRCPPLPSTQEPKLKHLPVWLLPLLKISGTVLHTEELLLHLALLGRIFKNLQFHFCLPVDWENVCDVLMLNI